MGNRWRDHLKSVHRGISLALLAIWLVQIASGVLLVFHREIDDAISTGPALPLDASLLAKRIERLEAESSSTRVTGVFLTSEVGRHFDVVLEDASGRSHVVRVDGRGTELLRRPMDAGIGAVFHALNRVHRSLAAGETGEWLIRVSGVLLLTNLSLALRLAWPPRGQWRAALLGRGGSTAAARAFVHHRVLGLWLVVPASIVVVCGTLLAFERPLVHTLGLQRAPPVVDVTGTAQPGALEEALSAAVAAVPDGEMSMIILPFASGEPIQVRFRGGSELRQTHGETRVYVDPSSAVVIHKAAPEDLPLAGRFLKSLFPIHTGQAGGWAGRGLVLLTGIGLLVLACLGTRLWWIRRRTKQPATTRPTPSLHALRRPQ